MPIVSGTIRAGLLASAAVACTGLIILIRHHPRALAGLAILILGVAFGVATTRTRPIQGDRLRAQIVDELRDHLNVPYMWGGENRRGIDCSGLPRNALRGAALRQSIETLNGHLAITAIAHWWHDASAKALGEEYQNNTAVLFEADSIRSVDHSRILPGDFAITSNGVHAICYVGNHHWIHASPDAGKVIEVDARNTDDGWFKVPIKMIRWRILENLPIE